MCLYADGRGNCERDAALLLRQVMPLFWCYWQDQVFRPIACDQQVLLSHRTQTNEREFAGIPRLPQPVEWYIGDAIMFRVPLGNVFHGWLVDRGWGRGLGSLARFFELRIVK
jgi:hypothetical protein